MGHIVVGLFLIALGLWGVFDEWYYVINFVKAGASVLLCITGGLAMLAAMARSASRPADSPDPVRPEPFDSEVDLHGSFR
jgi:cytochrome c biogenesis protein ResB